MRVSAVLITVAILLVSPAAEAQLDSSVPCVIRQLAASAREQGYGNLLQNRPRMVEQIGASTCGPTCLVNVLQKLKKAAGHPPARSPEALEAAVVEVVKKVMPEAGVNLGSSGMAFAQMEKLIPTVLEKNGLSAKVVVQDLVKDTAGPGLSETDLLSANGKDSVLMVSIGTWHRPRGQSSAFLPRDTFERGHIVAIGAYDPKTKMAVLIQSNSHGPRELVLLEPVWQEYWKQGTFRVHFVGRKPSAVSRHSPDEPVFMIKGAVKIQLEPR